jgi:hypothetical protein
MNKKFILIGIMLFLLGYGIAGIVDNLKLEKSKINENAECKGMNLLMTSECINKELNEFFMYNISNVGKDLDFNTLKTEGGVCQHFSNWIKERFLELGAKEIKEGEKLFVSKDNYPFYIKEVSFSVNNESAHRIAIASNDNGYCIFSNQNYKCTEFEDETK